MRPRPSLYLGLSVLILASLACNYIFSPFIPPISTPTPSILASMPRESGDLRLPTATSTPTPSPTPVPSPTEEPTLQPTPTLNSDKIDDPDRPSLSGDTLVYGTEHFLIHFTQTGRDAVTATDDDNTGIPDFVEAVGEAMEFAWQVEIEQLGWARPPSDGGTGGDARYDVYLEDIFDNGTAGYTDGGYARTMVGDNPFTPAVETDASSSFISLDNDYREDNILPVLDLLRVTAAHEFNHAIQYGLDANEPADWLWEATATWIEDVLYDDINDQDYYLDAVFDAPDFCQIAEGRDSTDTEGHWYGMWIFLRYLSEQHGNEIIRSIWENIVTQDGYTAIETSLEVAGSNLDEAMRGFAVALLTRRFEEGAQYPTLKLEGEIKAGQTFVPSNGVSQMAADYIQIITQETVQVILDGNVQEGIVVGLVGNEAHLFPLQEGHVFIDGSLFDYIYLVVLNLNRAQRESECRELTYTFSTRASNQADQPVDILAAPNFSPPRVKLLP